MFARILAWALIATNAVAALGVIAKTWDDGREGKKRYGTRIADLLLQMLTIGVLLSLLQGCATLPAPQRAAEATYQALHFADALQTLDIKNHPCEQISPGMLHCYREGNPLLGPYPSDGRVAAYMLAESLAHAYVTEQLVDNDAPGWVQWAWHIASIGYAANNVLQNSREGFVIKLQWGGAARNRIGQVQPVDCSAFAGCR